MQTDLMMMHCYELPTTTALLLIIKIITTSISARGGGLTQVLHTSNNFFGCLLYSCITYLLSQ